MGGINDGKTTELVHCTITGPCLCMHYRQFRWWPVASTGLSRLLISYVCMVCTRAAVYLMADGCRSVNYAIYMSLIMAVINRGGWIQRWHNRVIKRLAVWPSVIIIMHCFNHQSQGTTATVSAADYYGYFLCCERLVAQGLIVYGCISHHMRSTEDFITCWAVCTTHAHHRTPTRPP